MAYAYAVSRCDSKGRVALPASMRDGLPDDVIVVRSCDGDGCLILDPHDYGRCISGLFDERFGGFNIVNPLHLALFAKECASTERRKIGKKAELSLPKDILEVLPPKSEVVIKRVGEATVVHRADAATYEKPFVPGFGIAEDARLPFGDEIGLYGSFKTRFDSRRRIRVPSHLRGFASGEFIAFPAIKGDYLLAMRRDLFDSYVDAIFETRYGGFDSLDRGQMMLRAALKGYAFNCHLGKDGAWTVPAELADRALVPRNDVVMVGCGNHLEIYSETVFDEVVLGASWQAGNT